MLENFVYWLSVAIMGAGYIAFAVLMLKEIFAPVSKYMNPVFAAYGQTCGLLAVAMVGAFLALLCSYLSAWTLLAVDVFVFSLVFAVELHNSRRDTAYTLCLVGTMISGTLLMVTALKFVGILA